MPKWIDLPVMQVIDYFANTGVYFISIARTIGTILGFAAILWTCVKIAFGFMETQKGVIGMIAKMLFFIFIINAYPMLCSRLKAFSSGMGTAASGATVGMVTAQLAEFLRKMDQIVKEQEEAIAGEVLAELSQDRKAVAAADIWNQGSPSTYQPERLLDDQVFEQEVDRITEARRNQHDSSQRRTLEAIRTVLAPVDKDGNEVEDLSLADKYILKNIYLNAEIDGVNVGSAYLSPNAMLRIALLSAQIMWEKEWTSVDEEWQANYEANQEDRGLITRSLTKTKGILDFPVRRIWDMLLTFVSMLAIVLAMIFSCIQYVACIIEFTIVVSVGSVCLPFILMEEFKDVAAKVMPSLLGQAAKLVMITLCMWFGLSAFLDMAITTIGEGAGFNLTTFAYVFFIIILTWMLTQFAPKLAVALMTGQPQLSMGEMVAAMGTAMAVGNAAVRGATAVAGGATALATQGVPAAVRGAVNASGSMAAMRAAGRTAMGEAAGLGHGEAGQIGAGLKAMGAEAKYQAGQKFKSALHGYAHMGAGGKGMGGGGGGGAAPGVNRFGFNDDAMKDGKFVDTYKEREKLDPMSMDYASHKNKDGYSSTAGEFIRSQAAAGAARARGTVKPPKTHAKTARPATSSYIGSDYVAPRMLEGPPQGSPKQLTGPGWGDKFTEPPSVIEL